MDQIYQSLQAQRQMLQVQAELQQFLARAQAEAQAQVHTKGQAQAQAPAPSQVLLSAIAQAQQAQQVSQLLAQARAQTPSQVQLSPAQQQAKEQPISKAQAQAQVPAPSQVLLSTIAQAQQAQAISKAQAQFHTHPQAQTHAPAQQVSLVSRYLEQARAQALSQLQMGSAQAQNQQMAHMIGQVQMMHNVAQTQLAKVHELAQVLLDKEEKLAEKAEKMEKKTELDEAQTKTLRSVQDENDPYVMYTKKRREKMLAEKAEKIEKKTEVEAAQTKPPVSAQQQASAQAQDRALAEAFYQTSYGNAKQAEMLTQLLFEARAQAQAQAIGAQAYADLKKKRKERKLAEKAEKMHKWTEPGEESDDEFEDEDESEDEEENESFTSTDSEVQYLREDLDCVIEDFNDYKEENSKEIQNLKKQIAEIRDNKKLDENFELVSKNEELEGKLRMCHFEIEKLQIAAANESLKIQKTIEAKDSQIEEQRIKIDSLEIEYDYFQEQKDQKINDLENQLKHRNSVYEALKVKYENLARCQEKERDDLNEQIEYLNGELEARDDSIAHFDEDLDRELAKKDQIISELKVKLEEANKINAEKENPLQIEELAQIIQTQMDIAAKADIDKIAQNLMTYLSRGPQDKTVEQQSSSSQIHQNDKANGKSTKAEDMARALLKDLDIRPKTIAAPNGVQNENVQKEKLPKDKNLESLSMGELSRLLHTPRDKEDRMQKDIIGNFMTYLGRGTLNKEENKGLFVQKERSPKDIGQLNMGELSRIVQIPRDEIEKMMNHVVNQMNTMEKHSQIDQNDMPNEELTRALKRDLGIRPNTVDLDEIPAPNGDNNKKMENALTTERPLSDSECEAHFERVEEMLGDLESLHSSLTGEKSCCSDDDEPESDDSSFLNEVDCFLGELGISDLK